MLTQIDVMSDAAFELPILGVTPKNSLLVQKVTGLNPPDRSLFIGDYSQDGGLYQGRRVGTRNVVFTINLNPNPALGETVSKLRESLYKAFIDPQVDGDYLKLLLHDDDGREMYLVGYCEKFEAEVFDIDTMCQISMICPDPYLRDNVDTILTQSSGWVQVEFTYQGTAETGFIVHIYVTAPTDQITLDNNGKTMKLANYSTGYAVGDLIIINTIQGQRSISLSKAVDIPITPTDFNPPTGYDQDDLVFYGAGVWKCITTELSAGTTNDTAPGNNDDYWQFMSTPIVSNLDPKSSWLELHSVNNTLRVYSGNLVNAYIASIKYLKYTSAYWGI